jgi:hypothetical protein
MAFNSLREAIEHDPNSYYFIGYIDYFPNGNYVQIFPNALHTQACYRLVINGKYSDKLLAGMPQRSPRSLWDTLTYKVDNTTPLINYPIDKLSQFLIDQGFIHWI